MLCVSDKDVVLLQPTESDHQIINRTLGEFNTVVTCTFILYFTFLTSSEAVWYIILVPFVCLSVCLSDDNFQKPRRRKLIFAHMMYL